MYFKNWSVTRRLWILSAVMIFNVLVAGGIQWYGNYALRSSLVSISERDLPGIRLMTLVDMMHDGIRAAVFKALYFHSKGVESEVLAAKKELDEFSKNMREYIGGLETLAYDSESKVDIKKVNPEIEAYAAMAENIVGEIISRNTKNMEKHLGEFHSAFKALEERLEVLGEAIEKNSINEKQNADRLATRTSIVNGVIVFVSVLMGLFFSWYTINSLSRNLNRLMAKLMTESTQLEHSSNQINVASQKLSEATTEQAAAIEETVSSMEEMTAMLGQTTQQSAETIRVAEGGRSEGENAKSVIKRLAIAMDEIQSSNNKLEDLVKLINEIKTKTTVINDIVFETRLLAFNASIEAARAGVHGKGFAVVAEEVGKLAAMSGRAADEIRNLLESSTKEVTYVVKQTQDRVSTGKSVSQECEAVFTSLGESLQKILHCTRLIDSATKEQGVGIQQSNKAMSEMDQVTQTNSRSAEKLATEAGSLANASKGLFETIYHLKKMISGLEANLIEVSRKYDGGSSGQPISTTEDRRAEVPAIKTAQDKGSIERNDSRWHVA